MYDFLQITNVNISDTLFEFSIPSFTRESNYSLPFCISSYKCSLNIEPTNQTNVFLNQMRLKVKHICRIKSLHVKCLWVLLLAYSECFYFHICFDNIFLHNLWVL